MFGIDDVIGVGLKIIDKFIPDPAEKLKAQQALQQMQHDELMAFLAADTAIATAQSKVNETEAASDSLFKSGWRPFVGWVCGSAFALSAVILPVANYIVGLYGRPAIVVPMDTAMIMSVLFGMLGLGTMRTFEKFKGVGK